MTTSPDSAKTTRASMKTTLLLVAIALLLVYRAYQYWYWPTATVQVGKATLRTIVSDTYEHNVRGLGKRASLGAYDGMIFYFPSRAQHTMVMRDMKFPLDIVWIDHGMVIDIAKNLPPEAVGTPEANLVPYAARLPSTMVLELGAGKADAYGIQVGDAVRIGR